MTRKLVIYLVLVPLAIVILMFAAANRQVVTVSFDPFSASDPALSFAMPLFVLIFILVILGVIIGRFAAWLRQGRYRRTNRHLESEIGRLRRQVEGLNLRLDSASTAGDATRLPYRPSA